MAEQTATPATPAGNSADTQIIDVNAITQAAAKAATEAATAAVNAAIKPISEQVQTLQQGLANAPTTESVTKAVTDAITAQQAEQAKVSDRQKFINEHLKGIPDTFHSMIGTDPEKFEDDAKALRAALESVGFKADNVGGSASPSGTGGGESSGGAKPVTAAVDTSKLSGAELIGMGVQQTSGKTIHPADSPQAATPFGDTGTSTATPPTSDAAK